MEKTIIPNKGDLLTFFAAQHKDAPVLPLVLVGDRVLCGQIIAKAENQPSADVHASVSGFVVDITPVRNAKGNSVHAILIESDGQMETSPSLETHASLTRCVFTLSGRAFAHPGSYDVCIGMNLQSLVEASGGFQIPPKKIVLGSVMTGHCLSNLDVPITKGDSGILAFASEEVHIQDEQPCIRCSRCVAACQIKLLPYELNALFLIPDLDGFEQNGGLHCVECGSCSYVCPSKRHLTQSIRSAKKTMGIEPQF